MSPLPATLLFFLLATTRSFASPIAFRDLETRQTQLEGATPDFNPVVLLDYSAPITYPIAGVVFTAGGTGYVEWDQTLPSGVSQSVIPVTANLVLGYTSTSSVGLHYDLENPLGTNIPLYSGSNRYDFTFPSDLPTRTTYILSLQGSSGNISPEFTINGVGGAATSASSAELTTSTTTRPSVAFTPYAASVTTQSPPPASETSASVSPDSESPDDGTATSASGASSTTTEAASSTLPPSSLPPSSSPLSSTSTTTDAPASRSATGIAAEASAPVTKTGAAGSSSASLVVLVLAIGISFTAVVC